MAVKGGLSHQRFGYVSGKCGIKLRKREARPTPPSFTASSSATDSEDESGMPKKEVRDQFSVRKLMKESEHFKVDEDHIYTSVKESMKKQTELCNGTYRKRKLSDCDERVSKQKCLNKNALSAKLNRERKKQYMQSLENENKSLKDQNDELSKQAESQKKIVSQLTKEVVYLKNVLANSKELCQILGSIKAIGLPVSSSLVSITKQKDINDSLWEGNLNEFDKSNQLCEDDIHPPRTRHSSFPIVYNDINLGSIANAAPLLDLESPFCEISASNVGSNSAILTDLMLDEEKLNLGEQCGLSKEGGICLHLNNKMVSVEFCYLCNQNSALSILTSGT